MTDSSPFNPCIIIPIFNNRDSIRGVIDSIDQYQLPCLVVDDGSNQQTRDVLDMIGQDYNWVQVLRQPVNLGKGAAMEAGFRAADAHGFSHAVQIDADGQHNSQDIPRFIDAAQHAPGALILSRPDFADDAPKSRRYGRLVTTFFVWLETLSFEIKDTLCGFRCYPIKPVLQVYGKTKIGSGMVFDTELAVHLFWIGTQIRTIDTRVSYFDGGVSHFNYLHDNLRISWMHVKLLGGMLVRLPQLVGRKKAM